VPDLIPNPRSTPPGVNAEDFAEIAQKLGN
jgi:hypothetical protein